MPISNIIPNAKNLIAMRTDPDNRPELNRALDYVKDQLKGFTVECFERSGATSILAYRGETRPERFKVILCPLHQVKADLLSQLPSFHHL